MSVFRATYKAVGLGWLLAPTGWPVLKPLFDLIYRLFAKYRCRWRGWSQAISLVIAVSNQALTGVMDYVNI